MPDVYLDVAEELQAYLITNGVCVHAADADGVHPVVVWHPRDGAPPPVETDNLDFRPGTITLTTPTEPDVGEDHARSRTVVSILVWTPRKPANLMIRRQIENLLIPLDGWGHKKMFAMGAITVVENCSPFRGAQLVQAGEDGYRYEMAFDFLVRRKVLAGLPDY